MSAPYYPSINKNPRPASNNTTLIIVLAVAGVVLLVSVCLVGILALSMWASNMPQKLVASQTTTPNLASDNAKQLAIALVEYERSQGQFPPAAIGVRSEQHLSWRVAVLPFLNDKLLYTYINRAKKWDDQANIAFTIDSHSAFRSEACPESMSSNRTAFVAVVGPDTVLQPGQSHRRRSIADGDARTAIFLEVQKSDIAWAEPRDISVDEAVQLIRNCRDRSGLTVGLANGNTRKIPPNTSEEAIRELFNCSDFLPRLR